MVNRIIFSILLFLPIVAGAQTKSSTQDILRNVADNIVRTTSFTFVDTKTNEKFNSLQGKDTSSSIRAESKFNKWEYVNGVLTVGMLRLSDYLHDNKYTDYSRKNFNFIFSNLDYFKKMFDAGNNRVEWRPVFRIGSLDDCAPWQRGFSTYTSSTKEKITWITCNARQII